MRICLAALFVVIICISSVNAYDATNSDAAYFYQTINALKDIHSDLNSDIESLVDIRSNIMFSDKQSTVEKLTDLRAEIIEDKLYARRINEIRNTINDAIDNEGINRNVYDSSEWIYLVISTSHYRDAYHTLLQVIDTTNKSLEDSSYTMRHISYLHLKFLFQALDTAQLNIKLALLVRENSLK